MMAMVDSPSAQDDNHYRNGIDNGILHFAG
jgi:hypothetical protein